MPEIKTWGTNLEDSIGSCPAPGQCVKVVRVGKQRGAVVDSTELQGAYWFVRGMPDNTQRWALLCSDLNLVAFVELIRAFLRSQVPIL